MKNYLYSIIAFSFLSLTNIFADNTSYLFSPKGVAEVYITLSNGKKIDDIKNDKHDKDYVGKLDAVMVIKNSASSTYSESELYNGRIEIDGRGNTTWGVPKKPYNIDLVDNEAEENPFTVLGMPSDNEWALLAFWHDRSLMRIPLAFYLGNAMKGISYTPRLRYVEVYINNEYRGLYCFSEKVKRGDDRVKIKKLTADATDQIEPRVSGGYIIEACGDPNKSTEIEKASQFKTSKDINFIFKYPKAKNITNEQANWIKNYVNEFEEVLWNNKLFKDPVDGYQKYMNEDSFIDWTILHELSNGTDNLFHASVFVHKERNGKLNMSAPWDFDISFGNERNNDAYYEDRVWVRNHRWFGQLYKDERYAKKFNDRYEELIPLFDQIPHVLKANYQQLENSGCLEREYKKWPQILAEYQDKEGRKTPNTYSGHVRWLSEWFESRKTWTYINLGLTEEERCQRLKDSKPTIRIMNPESFENGGTSVAKIMRGYTYIWNDSKVVSTENYTIDQDGKHWVQIRDSKGCTSLKSNAIAKGDKFTDIDLISTNHLIVYPNPVDNLLFINYPSEEKSSVIFQLINIQGSVVKEVKDHVKMGANRYELNLSGHVKGLYILKCKTDKETIVKKFIKR